MDPCSRQGKRPGDPRGNELWLLEELGGRRRWTGCVGEGRRGPERCLGFQCGSWARAGLCEGEAGRLRVPPDGVTSRQLCAAVASPAGGVE